VAALLEAGADRALGSQGWTPVKIAEACGHAKVAALLAPLGPSGRASRTREPPCGT
jgi:hypothetical protein